MGASSSYPIIDQLLPVTGNTWCGSPDHPNQPYEDDADPAQPRQELMAGMQIKQVVPETGSAATGMQMVPPFELESGMTTATQAMVADFGKKTEKVPRLESESERCIATQLQPAVDAVFGQKAERLLGLEFSFTIADLSLPDLPLIGCSRRFTKFFGYDLHEVVGRNCRFLEDRVPVNLIDHKTCRLCDEFCDAVRSGKPWTTPSYDPYASPDMDYDELISVQTNACKDGTMFSNVFIMKLFEFSSVIGQQKPYIVALQSELHGDREDISAIVNNIRALKTNMAIVHEELSSLFYVECVMSRQDSESD